MTTPDLPAGITAVSEPLPGLQIRTDAADADVVLQGAQLTHWQPRDAEPVLWTSAESRWQQGVPVRGGIPICFPWFGPGRTADETNPHPREPAHGWARISTWTLRSASVSEDGIAELEFELEGSSWKDSEYPDVFPHDAVVKYRMRIGRRLELEFEVVAGEVLVDVEQALHTYLAVDDVAEVAIEGLDGAPYLDKVTGEDGVQQGPLTIEGEVDRVHTSDAPVQVVGPQRTLRITKENSASTIVWNPGPTKAGTMADFGDEEYRRMVCVEQGNVLAEAITIAPGHNHVMKVQIEVC